MHGPLELIRGNGLDAPEEHETTAAFRTRLADSQEHLGKTMRSVATWLEMLEAGNRMTSARK